MKCSEVKKHHKTASFSSNHRFWSFALNIRMVSAPLSNMLSLFIELSIYGIFLYYDLNKMFGSGQEHHKTPFFSSKSYIPSVRSYITRYCEGPGEQPGMTIVLPLTHEHALYHKAVHSLACLPNALQYQLNENLQRLAAAAFE